MFRQHGRRDYNDLSLQLHLKMPTKTNSFLLVWFRYIIAAHKKATFKSLVGEPVHAMRCKSS